MLEVCIFSSCFASCLMSPNLRIAVLRRCAFFQIHRLENGVLSVLLLDGESCLLNFSLALQSGVLGFLFFLFGGIVGEEVELENPVISRTTSFAFCGS